MHVSGSFADFLADYTRRAAPLMREVNEAYWAATTTGRPEEAERAAEKAAALRKLHAVPEEYAALKRWQAEGAVRDPLLARQLTLLCHAYAGNQIPPDKIEEITRREQEIESCFANFRPVFGGGAASENDLRQILVKENDNGKRKEAWEASKLIGREVAPLLLDLVAERNEAARRLGYDNFFVMQLELNELDEAELFAILGDLQAATAKPFAALKAGLDAELSARFRVPSAELRPWHYADPFFQEPPPTGAVDVDQFFAGRDVVALARDFYAGLDLPIADVIERSDLYERPGKNQHAYCMDVDREGDVRILANVRGNEQWMSTMLHESGHAAYSKYHDRALPLLLRDAAHTLTTEAVAMLMGRLTKNADWLQRYLGVGEGEARAAADVLGKHLRLGELIFIRWGLVMVYFERELYRDPGQDLNRLWWRLVGELQGINPPEGRDAPDYASKIHLGTAPVYYQNYLLGTLTASQIKAALPLTGGDGLVGDKAAGSFLRERIFKVGARLPWQEMLMSATGSRLSAAYFAREFVRER